MSGSSGVVIFNYTNWAALYTTLATWVTPTTGQMYFNLATVTIDNSACSPITDASQPGGVRETILYAVTAHYAYIFGGDTGSNGSPLVGRIASANEGSVSVNVEMAGEQAPSAAWFMQSKYGAIAWSLLTPYRLGGRVTRQRRRYLGVSGYGVYGGYG